jgi:CHAT domain-containing protein
LGLQTPPIRGEALPFDLQKAHALYRALFGQFEDLIKGKHLLVVPSGPLTSLPFSVLVTEAPDPKVTGADSYRRAAWLGVRQPITVLPSVASLQALRRFAKPSHAKNVFIGFGNPLLKGRLGGDRSAWAVQQCPPRDMPASVQQVAEAVEPPGEPGSVFRGALADVNEVRRLSPLPDTTKELCAVARTLGVPEDQLGASVWLGERATESVVKELSQKDMLSTYSIVHFATHGLIAGEVKNLAETALVLTPPETATEADDGLLTASEVTQLKLNADWVVMSACNTAAGTTHNAEALSGLARAFFYAGARALLVSHWQVNSQAAVKLTTGALTALRTQPSIGRAEALRQSMLKLIKDGSPEEAHPENWAPFVVVGEGAR